MKLTHCVRIFFVNYLPKVKGAGTQTVQSYKDAFGLFIPYAARFLDLDAGALTLPDLSTDLVLSFLDHLEKERQNSGATRNQRLAALKSMAKMINLMVAEHTAYISQIPETLSRIFRWLWVLQE